MNITIPAPTGGWNTRDSLAEMPPNFAPVLDNIVPFGNSVRTRPGHVAHSDDIGSAVQTLVTYHGSTEKLLCAAGGEIYDISAGGAGTSLTGSIATLSSNKWETTEFKDLILFVNGTDSALEYNGTTMSEMGLYTGSDLVTNGTFDADASWTKGTGWTISGGTASCDGTQVANSDLSQTISTIAASTTYVVQYTVSGYSAGTLTPLAGGQAGTAVSADGTYTDFITTPSPIGIGGDTLIFRADADFVGSVDNVTLYVDGGPLFSQAVTHHGRVYYVEEDTQSFWYASAGAYKGALTEYDLSEFTTSGGSLLYLVSWTRDSGAGVDDLLVCMMDTGEFLVYSGSDPGSATDWTLIGVFQIGRPLGIRSYYKVGGDVIIATVDGYVPLSATIQEGRYTEQSSYSSLIDPTVKSAAQTYADNFGWSLIYWPQASMFIVNVPISGTESVQHVRNTTKGGWCRFTGLNASQWAVYSDDLYFCSPDGFVYKMTGASDQGAFIPYRCRQAANYFGNPHTQKQVTAAEPVTNFTYPKYIQVRFHADHEVIDFDDPAAPPEPTSSEWNVGSWNSASWVTGGTGTLSRARRNAAAMGYALSLDLRFKSRSQTVTWYSTHIWFNQAGVI